MTFQLGTVMLSCLKYKVHFPLFLFQHYLYELVIKMLVHHSLFYMLHQFLQYHVLSDSKPLVSPQLLETKLNFFMVVLSCRFWVFRGVGGEV